MSCNACIEGHSEVIYLNKRLGIQGENQRIVITTVTGKGKRQEYKLHFEFCPLCGDAINPTPKTFNQLTEQVNAWADEKGIGTAENWRPQFSKISEEITEYRDELTKTDRSYSNVNHEKLEMGDILVTLIIMAKQRGYTVNECLAAAYDKIKDRKGKTIDGTFVKESDD